MTAHPCPFFHFSRRLRNISHTASQTDPVDMGSVLGDDDEDEYEDDNANAAALTQSGQGMDGTTDALVTRRGACCASSFYCFAFAVCARKAFLVS